MRRQSVHRPQVFGEFSTAVVNGNITATKLTEELALRKTCRARSLTERGFLRDKKTNGQMQGRITD